MKSIGERSKRKASQSKIEVSPNDDKEPSHKAAKRKGVAITLEANKEVEKTVVESSATTVTLDVSYDGRRLKDFTRDEEQDTMTGYYVSLSAGVQSESRHKKVSVTFNKEAREVNFSDDVMPKVVEALEGMVPVPIRYDETKHKIMEPLSADVITLGKGKYIELQDVNVSSWKLGPLVNQINVVIMPKNKSVDNPGRKKQKTQTSDAIEIFDGAVLFKGNVFSDRLEANRNKRRTTKIGTFDNVNVSETDPLTWSQTLLYVKVAMQRELNTEYSEQNVDIYHEITSDRRVSNACKRKNQQIMRPICRRIDEQFNLKQLPIHDKTVRILVVRKDIAPDPDHSDKGDSAHTAFNDPIEYGKNLWATSCFQDVTKHQELLNYNFQINRTKDVYFSLASWIMDLYLETYNGDKKSIGVVDVKAIIPKFMREQLELCKERAYSLPTGVSIVGQASTSVSSSAGAPTAATAADQIGIGEPYVVTKTKGLSNDVATVEHTISWLDRCWTRDQQLQLQIQKNHRDKYEKGSWFDLLQVTRTHATTPINNESFLLKDDKDKTVRLKWKEFSLVIEDAEVDVDPSEDDVDVQT